MRSAQKGNCRIDLIGSVAQEVRGRRRAVLCCAAPPRTPLPQLRVSSFESSPCLHMAYACSRGFI